MGEKKRIVRNIGSSFLILGGIVVIGIILFATTREYKRVKHIDTLIAEQKEYRDHIERKNGLLEELIAYKETTISRERAARERGYRGADENVIVIKDNAHDTLHESQASLKNQDMTNAEPYRAWHHLFFNKQ